MLHEFKNYNSKATKICKSYDQGVIIDRQVWN